MPSWRTGNGVFTIVIVTGEATNAQNTAGYMSGVLVAPRAEPAQQELSLSKSFTPVEEEAPGAVALDGIASAASDLDGTLSIDIALDAKASAASDLDGTLSLALPLDAKASAAADLDGTLGITRGLDGNASAAADLDGTLSVTRGLDGNASAAADLDGTLTVSGSGVVALDGKAPASANFAGDLSVFTPAPPPSDPTWMILVSTEGAILPRDMRGPGTGEPQRRGQARRRGSGRISP